jgi:hypothetical protein
MLSQARVQAKAAARDGERARELAAAEGAALVAAAAIKAREGVKSAAERQADSAAGGGQGSSTPQTEGGGGGGGGDGGADPDPDPDRAAVALYEALRKRKGEEDARQATRPAWNHDVLQTVVAEDKDMWRKALGAERVLGSAWEQVRDGIIRL